MFTCAVAWRSGGLVVLFQKKAWVERWMDRPVAVEWVEKVIKPFIEPERKAGVADESTHYLLFQDNLDAQKQPAYIDALKALGVDDHTRCRPTRPTRCSPLIDRGLGRHIKMYIGLQMDEWLEDDANLERWESTEKGTGAEGLRPALLRRWVARRSHTLGRSHTLTLSLTAHWFGP